LVAVPTALIINDGTIRASAPGLLGDVPLPGSLTININDPQGQIDLDGAAGNGIVTVTRLQTLDVNATLFDPFSGDMNLFHNSEIDISTAWTLDAGGTIDADNGFSPGLPPFIPSVNAAASHISGGALTQTGGTITVVDNDGTLIFNAPFTMNGGNLVNNGLVVFNAKSALARTLRCRRTYPASPSIPPSQSACFSQTLIRMAMVKHRT
jgi:hypothetical protein